MVKKFEIFQTENAISRELFENFSKDVALLTNHSPVVLENVPSPYLNEFLENFRINQINGDQEIKIMILGKHYHGKTHLINLIFRREAVRMRDFYEENRDLVEFYRVQHQHMRIFFIDVDCYSDGNQYLINKETIRKLIFIHKPSVIWYVRLSNDTVMTTDEIKELLCYNELNVEIILILNKNDERQQNLRSWQGRLMDNGLNHIIKKCIFIPHTDVQHDFVLETIISLVQSTISCVLNVYEERNFDQEILKNELKKIRRVFKEEMINPSFISLREINRFEIFPDYFTEREILLKRFMLKIRNLNGLELDELKMRQEQKKIRTWILKRA